MARGFVFVSQRTIGDEVLKRRGLHFSGEVMSRDWRLYECDQESGREYLVAWGDPESVRNEMHQRGGRGCDVWIIDPDGGKEVLP